MGSESILIALAVLAWLLWRQLQVRELRHDRELARECSGSRSASARDAC